MPMRTKGAETAFLRSYAASQRLWLVALLSFCWFTTSGSQNLRAYFFCDGGTYEGFSCFGLADVESCGGGGTCVQDIYIDPCGNGYRLQDEECDDGNLEDGDGCSSTCKNEVGWLCEGGSGSSPDVCAVVCGDGVKMTAGCCDELECSQECYGEKGCDDGNAVAGDGCSELCTVETGFTCYGSETANSGVCLCTRQRVSAGHMHTCAISSNYKLVCWGEDKYNKTKTDFNKFTGASSWPRDIWNELDVWVSVTAGHNHNCALKFTGAMMCWGWIGPSALGDGRIYMMPAPDWERTSAGGLNWGHLSAGNSHTCGVLNERRFRYRPECGPDETPGDGCERKDDCTECRARGDWGLQWLERHPCYLSYVDETTCTEPANKTLVCWGDDSYKQIQMPVYDAWTDLSSGYFHSCGVMDNGTAMCWGNNNYEQSRTPKISSDWLQIAAGGSHTCGIDVDGYMHCWGRNFEGQATVPCDDSWLRVAAGWLHTCAIQSDFSMRCWGANDAGQSTVPHERGVCQGGTRPGQGCDTVADCPGVESRCSAERKRDWTQVSAGGQHTCAVDMDNIVYCWGNNADGQLEMPGGKCVKIGEGLSGQDIIDCRGMATGTCL